MAEKSRKLTVEIVGDAKKLNSELDGSLAKMDGWGKKFKAAGPMAATALAGAAVAAGAALYKIGGDLDAVSDTFRTMTGASGKALDNLNRDFKAVAKTGPESFEAVGTTLAQLNQKLGATGAPLQKLGRQFLDLARITGTDVANNVDAASSAFVAWGIKGADQSKMLDTLFRVSQKTGVGVAELSTSLAQNQVVLKASGFSVQESAALFGVLGKAGLDASTVMPALGKAMATAGKDGKDAGVLISETFAAIKAAPDATSAAGIAMDVFGAKAGPKLAAAIRDGKLGYEELMASLAKGDSIDKAAKETADFAEKWGQFKNTMMLEIAPAATAAFDAIGKGTTKLASAVEDRNPVILAALGAIAVAATLAAVAMAAAAISWGFSWVAMGATAMANAVIMAGAWIIALGPIAWVAAAVAALAVVIWRNWDTIKDATAAVGRFIADTWDWIVGIVSGIGGRISGVAGGMWDGISRAFKAALNVIIRGWNALEFRIPGFSVGPVKWDGFTLGVPNIPSMHTGGTFIASTPGGEGMALLRDRERIVPPSSGLGSLSGHGGGSVTNNSVTQNITIDATGMRPDDVIELIRKYERSNGASWRGATA